MKTVICAATLALFVLPLSAAAHGRRDRHYAERVERVPARGEVHVVFSRGDVGVLREYYAPRYRNLPPGLQKKLARTGHLPPGWERRVEPFPVIVERRLVVLPADYRRGVIDGNAVIYSRRSGIIIDATVLF
jgi:hypothetical protein